MKKYGLIKSNPKEYSFDNLLNDKKIIMDESTHINLEINVERKSFNIFLIK